VYSKWSPLSVTAHFKPDSQEFLDIDL